MVKFDFSLISSIVIFDFTSSGSEDSNIKRTSIISDIPGGRVYPVDDVAYFSCQVNFQSHCMLIPF